MPIAIFDIRDESNPTSHFRHINTYEENPASTALSLKNTEIIETEQLAERAAIIEKYLIAELIETRRGYKGVMQVYVIAPQILPLY
jgi:adenosylmethionine-8-amino-7-oxononanoate aminotransferase